MARVKKRGARVVLVADCAEEQALLDHGQREGKVVLQEAYYPVEDEALILPDGTLKSAAEQLAVAFRAAAKRHAEAEYRRRRFRAV